MKTPLEVLNHARAQRDKWAALVAEVEASCLVCISKPTASEISPSRGGDQLRHFAPGGKYNGLISKAAARCGVSSSTVARVAHGKTSNPKISAALTELIASVDAAAPETVDPLTYDEYLLFARGGELHGTYVRLAKHLNVNPSYVGNVATGRYYSRSILIALRAEIGKTPITPHQEPLSEAERAFFQRGGACFGQYGVVAAKLGVHIDSVKQTSRGRQASRRILASLRACIQAATQGARS